MHSSKMFSLVFAGSLMSALIVAAVNTAHADVKQADARNHFDAGTLAFDQARFADAALEFEQAYALEPAWQVLYNLGAVYAALGRSAEAAAAFELYLEQGVGSIGADRGREVESELARQRAKTGELEITVSDSGAELRVDNRLVGRSPLPRPIRLSAGSHTVDAVLERRTSEHREVIVRAGDHARLSVTLVPTLAPQGSQPRPLMAAAVPAAVVHEDSSSGTAQRIASYAIGGLGLVGVGVGVAVVASGQSKHLDAVDLANAGDRPAAVRLESDANHQKTLGYATAAISGAVVLAGIVLLLSAPSSSAHAALHVSSWASLSSAGLVATGVF
jgi:hypothetical protein